MTIGVDVVTMPFSLQLFWGHCAPLGEEAPAVSSVSATPTPEVKGQVSSREHGDEWAQVED